MQETPEKENPGGSGAARWIKRLGFAGFMFFLIKGLLWLVVFALAYFGIANFF